MVADFAAATRNLPIVRFMEGETQVLAILGFGHPGQSFKDLLAHGMVGIKGELGELQPGQPLLIDSSGNAAAGVALEGSRRGFPVHVVTSRGIPRSYEMRIRHLGATIHFADTLDPVGGWQASRARLCAKLLQENPAWVHLDQNNDSRINVGAYDRYLIPQVAESIDPADIDASVLCVGSGGHFSSLNKWLKSGNPKVRSYAVDRVGSITFGDNPTPSFLRGVGNLGNVPQVIQDHKYLVDDVVRLPETSAIQGCQTLSKQTGLFVGGSAGLTFAAIREIAATGRHKTILTLFADRGDAYIGSPLYPLEDEQ